MAIKRDELTENLLARFPDLSGEYRARLAWQPEAGSHAIFANVFTPYLIKQMNTAENGQQVAAAFEFIDELAGNRAPGVQEVVAESVLQPLLHHPTALRLAWPFMRETTRRIIWALAEADGLTRKLPGDAV